MTGVTEVDIDHRIHVWLIVPEGSGFVAAMPGRDVLRGGSEYVIYNSSPTHSVEVVDADSATIGLINPSKAVRLSWMDLGPGSYAGLWTYTQLLDFTEGTPLSPSQVEYSITIESDAEHVVVRELLDARGYDGTSIVDVTVLIPIDVVVYGIDPTFPALRIGSLPATSVVTLINNGGEILGAGGAGGQGAGGGGLTSGFGTFLNALPGGAGGVALANDAPGGVVVRVDNAAGTIAGGGGGGGGGGGTNSVALGYRAFGGGGGGGRSHRGVPAGGPITPGRRGFLAAGDGGPTAGGAGGVGGVVAGTLAEGSEGGAGGGWGASGNDGDDGGNTSAPFATGAAGGAGGAAVSGNAGITWLATGTRIGAIT